MSRRATFTIEDHLCRICNGRILCQAAGGRPSGGGNPLYRCADCGASTCSTGPMALCWCGYTNKGQSGNPFRCKPFSGNEHLRNAFFLCGHNPDGNAEVGFVTTGECVDTRS